MNHGSASPSSSVVVVVVVLSSRARVALLRSAKLKAPLSVMVMVGPCGSCGSGGDGMLTKKLEADVTVLARFHQCEGQWSSHGEAERVFSGR